MKFYIYKNLNSENLRGKDLLNNTHIWYGYNNQSIETVSKLRDPLTNLFNIDLSSIKDELESIQTEYKTFKDFVLNFPESLRLPDDSFDIPEVFRNLTDLESFKNKKVQIKYMNVNFFKFEKKI